MSAALAPSWPHAAQPPRATDDLEEIDEGDLWEDSGDVVARALADSGGDSGPAPAAAPGGLTASLRDANGVASPQHLTPHVSSSSDDEGLDVADLDRELASAALERSNSPAQQLPAPSMEPGPLQSVPASASVPSEAHPAGPRRSTEVIDVRTSSPSRLLRTSSDTPSSARHAGRTTSPPAEVKMGTSVPVAIPMAARHMVAATAGPPDADAADGDPRAATFVPPHQLLQRMSGADRFSLGVSAGGESASLKRDRLLQRNTILRRTGFIEGGRLGPRTSSFLETIPAINEVDVEGGGSSFGRPSALSAALGTSLGTSPADARRRTYN